MARPRQASDEDLLKATFRAITALGPARLTLADVAREAGVTPAVLVQRFGSKRALLLAAAADMSGGDAYIFPALRARHRSPVAAVLGLADCMALFGETPGAVTNNLAFAHASLEEADFHRHALDGSRRMRAGIRALVRHAIAAGEIKRTPAARLADAVHATLTGSLMTWAVHRQGSLAAWLRRDLRTVLDPYRVR